MPLSSVTIKLCSCSHRGSTVVTGDVIKAISVCEIQYSMWAACDKHTGEERKMRLPRKDNTGKEIQCFTVEKSAKNCHITRLKSDMVITANS